MSTMTAKRVSSGRLAGALLWAVQFLILGQSAAEILPLPEHPRPDFERPLWLNLNGQWELRFDPQKVGEREGWMREGTSFPQRILVPFPWGSELSGVRDEADIAWYGRSIRVPADWQGKRVFLVVGASDWRTTAWLDGSELRTHRGGYTPFEFELTSRVHFGSQQRLVLSVDDTPHHFKLEGKQGYGPARGIWQTVYLEARESLFLDALHFTPDIDEEKVGVRAYLSGPAPERRPGTFTDVELGLLFRTGDLPRPVVHSVPRGAREATFDIPVPRPRLWSPADPFLYEVDAVLRAAGGAEDLVHTYFGMRKISVLPLPGSGHPYIALNNRPLYLQMTLDQAYHPEGFYTFPSDEFMRDEILRSRQIGLNAMRVHVKIEIPRKLYWADRLGMLIMADVPNSWGEPTQEMRQETETALLGMIHRDYNHPSIFSWVIFNETWGLRDKEGVYRQETQEWVASLYRLVKGLDPTRLVEDNSPNREDHVISDINSWHSYLPGHAWKEKLDEVTGNTFPGSGWNFVEGRRQENQPLLNSECGNVWGYEGSTGDVDWSWDYHIMINEFRRHPGICGWLYTEHHDVINEWNGYYRYGRSEKYTGLSDLVEGMSLRDLHAPFYVASGSALCRDVRPGEKVQVPLWLSLMTGQMPRGSSLILRTAFYGWNSLGGREFYSESSRNLPFVPWMSAEVDPIELNMPDHPALVVLALFLEDGVGTVLHRNFTAFLVSDGPSSRDEVLQLNGKRVRAVRFAPPAFHGAKWSLKQWNVLDGLKVNGAGYGYFEYRTPWPRGLNVEDIEQASFLMEASAKQLFSKDREDVEEMGGNYMLGKGTRDPSRNPNSYPMTDTVRFPSAVRIRVGQDAVVGFDLEDDPADHRGILSWHSQKRDRRLHEAGSYGYLLSAAIPTTALQKAAQEGEIVIRLEVDEALPGGLAIYGERFGRYPLDPTLAFVLARRAR